MAINLSPRGTKRPRPGEGAWDRHDRHVLFFTAPWSTPGRLMLPTARRAAASHGLPFRCVDVEREPEAVGKYTLRGLPVLILAEGERVLRRWTGFRSGYEVRTGLAAAVRGFQ